MAPLSDNRNSSDRSARGGSSCCFPCSRQCFLYRDSMALRRERQPQPDYRGPPPGQAARQVPSTVPCSVPRSGSEAGMDSTLPGSQIASDKLRTTARCWQAGPRGPGSLGRRACGEQGSGESGPGPPRAGSCPHTHSSAHRRRPTPIPLSSGPTGGSDCPAEPGPSALGHFTHYGFSPSPACQKLKGLGSQTRDFPMAFSSASSKMKITTLSHVAAWGTNEEAL